MDVSKEPKRAQKEGVDLLSFFEAPPARPRQEGAGQAKAEVQLPSASAIEGELIRLLRSKGGRVTKTELYSWAKKRGIPPASLYRAVTSLLQGGRIAKRFDEKSEDLVYELIKP